MVTPRRPGGIMSITYGRDTISVVISSVESRGFGDASGDTAVRMLTKPHLLLRGQCFNITNKKHLRIKIRCQRMKEE